MGQTLTHGVYLPDEGERNCYSGLAANWQILDSSVGTIAEHTTQIAGKAPAVHTHTKSDITDFPAYGNTAGTICEGNDSRLSDARTPVAHTHTKSDVTDLLNSNFIPSANNSYNLGSSSYQWNNIYSKSYYYNGVAWGLDKENSWSNTNYFSYSLYQKVFTARASIPSSNEFGTFIISDFNAASVMSLNYANRATGVRDLSLRVYDQSGNANGVMVNKDASNNYSFCSINPANTIELGTSTNKWKSLNGINPGALSLPDIRSGVQMDITNWDNRASPSGVIGTFTAPVDCIISIQMTRDVDWSVWVINGNFRQTFRSANNSGNHLLFLTFPVAKGEGIGIYCPVIPSNENPIIFVSNKQLYFPCLGNV